MSRIKRIVSGNRKRPEVVTGNFQLHYEDIIKQNRYIVIAVVGFAIMAIAAIVPFAVYHSLASPTTVNIETENATVPANGVVVGRDPRTSDGEFIEFTAPAK